MAQNYIYTGPRSAPKTPLSLAPTLIPATPERLNAIHDEMAARDREAIDALQRADKSYNPFVTRYGEERGAVAFILDGSSDGNGHHEIDPQHIRLVRDAAAQMAQNGWRLILGGKTGLSRHAIEAYYAAGGREAIVYTAPELVQRDANGHAIIDDCDGMVAATIMAETLDERKVLMMAAADAFVVGPGGLHTLDIGFELLTNTQVGEPLLFRQGNTAYKKPLYFLGKEFWQPLYDFAVQAKAQKFIGDHDDELVDRYDNASDISKELRKHLNSGKAWAATKYDHLLGVVDQSLKQLNSLTKSAVHLAFRICAREDILPNQAIVKANAEQLRAEIDAVMPGPKIMVYCGSRPGLGREGDEPSPYEKEMAYAVGALLAKHDIGLVYGGAGSDKGCMAWVAKGALETARQLGKKPKVLGISPVIFAVPKRQTATNEGLHKDPDHRTIVVPDMQTRKYLMRLCSIATISLIGGYGTLDEHLGDMFVKKHTNDGRALYLFNFRGYWDIFKNRLIPQVISAGYTSETTADLHEPVDFLAGLEEKIIALKNKHAITAHKPNGAVPHAAAALGL